MNSPTRFIGGFGNTRENKSRPGRKRTADGLRGRLVTDARIYPPAPLSPLSGLSAAENPIPTDKSGGLFSAVPPGLG